jgi:lysine decarboxylase
LAPYPPGIPVVAPGEEITEKHIAYLQKKSYNIEEEIAVTRHPQYKGGTP